MSKIGAEIVDFGLSLVEKIHDHTDALDRVKDILRQDLPPGNHVLHGSKGAVCTVVVQPTQIHIRSSVDMDEMQKALGPDFNRIFHVVETLVLMPDFEQAMPTMSPEKVALVNGVLDVVTPKRRVSFKRSP